MVGQQLRKVRVTQNWEFCKNLFNEECCHCLIYIVL